jgi:hypothetical protein
VSRTVPRLLGRFNYWDFPGIQPEVDPPAEWLAKLERSARSLAIRERPAASLGGDHQRLLQGLQYRMLSDPWWATDTETQKALARLPARDRARLMRRVHRTGASSPLRLLRRIATDQLVWERRALDGRRRDDIAKDFRLDPREVTRIMSHYNRKAHALQGLSVEFRGKPLQELRLLADRGRVTLRGRRMVMGGAVGRMTIDELRHWFAHALRNLDRWGERHPPLPWKPTCRSSCLAHRDNLGHRAR